MVDQCQSMRFFKTRDGRTLGKHGNSPNKKRGRKDEDSNQTSVGNWGLIRNSRIPWRSCNTGPTAENNFSSCPKIGHFELPQSGMFWLRHWIISRIKNKQTEKSENMRHFVSFRRNVLDHFGGLNQRFMNHKFPASGRKDMVNLSIPSCLESRWWKKSGYRSPSGWW